jgi:transglutaminase-like putative cysteine protease
MESFLESSKYVDYDSALIVEKANELFSGNMTNMEKVKAAYLFVRDGISHSFDCNAQVITAVASDVLKHRTGICHAKANLLVALLRSQGIPTGFCFQHLTRADDDSMGYCLHCFNAILVNNEWVKVDARGSANGKIAPFLLGTPILAFENRTQYDEYFFEGIYAAPDIPTMKMLECAKTLQDVITGLPEKPSGKPDICV